ncbi:MAG: OsmC family protein [Cyclobacteriaceae bacterium]|nr:OsmC family protein [Cyclobacteriaceae bacterium]
MKIEINRLNDGFWMEAVNENGNKIHIDASPEVGGTDRGFRPMQMLLAALGGCSSIDIISILKKQKQPLEDIKITITGNRQKDVVPSLFTEAHVHFTLYGNLDEDKVKKAVVLSVEKYCSVAKTLEKTATITHSLEIINS